MLNAAKLNLFPDALYWFGCVHVLSVVISFLSILMTSVMFNDMEDPGKVLFII